MIWFFSTAWAVTWTVDPAGAYPTIGDAVAASSAGDVIEILAGTYDEHVVLSHDLTLQGVGSAGDVVLTSTTGSVEVVLVQAIVDIRNLEIDATGIRGVTAERDSELLLQGVWIHDADMGYDDGGCIWSEADRLHLRHSRLQGCVAGDGAGVYLQGGTEVLVRNTVFRDNDAVGSGGAISVGVGPKLEIRNSVFRGNDASTGGAIHRRGANFGTSTVIVHGTTFVGNHANWGGAIYADQAGEVDIARSRFCGNSADIEGGAMHVTDAQPRTNTTFSLRRSLLVDNHAPEGGAVYLESYDVSYEPPEPLYGIIQFNTFVSNGADEGAHLELEDEVEMRVWHNIFAHGDGPGAGVYQRDLGRGTRNYNLWWDNTGGDLDGPRTGYQDLFVDPEFVAWSDDGDCSNDDLTLQETSPALDGGLPTFMDSDGTRADIGMTGG